MSERDETPAKQPAQRPGGGGGFRGPGGHGLGAPVAKPKDFKDSGKRLLGLLRPHRFTIAIVILLAIFSVSFNVAGPRILGEVTNVLFQGVVSAQMKPGETQQQAVAALRASGQPGADQVAQMV